MSPQQTIWIARHGSRLDFVDPDWYRNAENPYDPPLSDDGVIQARQLGRRLAGEGIRRIYSSPFLRAVQTAAQVADVLDLEVEIERGACEWFNPDWFPACPSFIPAETLTRQFPRVRGRDDSNVHPGYPETWEDLMTRSVRTMKALTRQTSEDLLIVGHGATLLGFSRALAGDAVEVHADFCALAKIVGDGQQWRMELNGDTSHLTRTSDEIRFV